MLVFVSGIFIGSRDTKDEKKVYTVYDGDHMLGDTAVWLLDTFHQVYPQDTWALEFLPFEWSFSEPGKPWWRATARTMVNTGETFAWVEYMEDGETAQEALKNLMEEMKMGRDTFRIANQPK